MALTDYRCYTQVCRDNKFPDMALFEKKAESEDLLTYTSKLKQHQKNTNERDMKPFTVTNKYTFSHDEWQTIIAICRLETANFTSDAYVYGNNFGGLSVSEEPLSYETKQEGLEAYLENMVTNYFDEGLHTPEEIGSKYCPVNPDWANLIKELKEEEITQWEQYLLL